ncbi:TrkH family potassium uptake protein [uncultured Eubacterium sp.]|uniref:TrkH family potassium uptake protein n=1 Tax=uncultured Eubacterium sp. TaxID=165185 RepID=UPI0025EA1D8E|nr:TrkH family potassium uptake protein [uncultured Eubacterium sp.]
MNGSIIRKILGYVLILESGLLLLPSLVALIYKESVGKFYIGCAALTFLCGLLLAVKKAKNTVFYLKEGCVATALSWILLSFFGALPFYFSGEIPSLVDAMFETVSGFTTTGSSILADVESLSHAAIFWRSFTHWIGGMGVLVFLLAVVQMSGGSSINLMKSESPGPSVGKLVPKMKHTARILYFIYLALTVLEVILLVCGDMPLFEALATSFGTAGTGGFGIKNDSMGGYSTYIQWTVTVFMLLFGVNFNFYYFFLLRQFSKAFKMEEVRTYIIIVLVATGIVFSDVVHIYSTVGEALCKSFFQVATVITTTGFSTADFNLWSSTSKTVLVMLMFVGACAGSTGGGIKVSRFVIVSKSIGKEIQSYLHPKSVKKISFDGKPVDHDIVRATNVYYVCFVLVFVVSLLIVSFQGFDLTTNFTSVAAAINNIGPGLNLVGPTENFGKFSDLSKFVLMFDMLAGRLELFPMLILISPRLWIESFNERLRAKY